MEKSQLWKLYKSYIYDYIQDNNLDWPCTTCSWGPVISENSEFIKQRLFFACRTDGIYNDQDNCWSKLPSYIVVANVDIPKPGKYFDQDIRNVYLQDNLKKHKNLKVKQIIYHPGDANVMKRCQLNPKVLATKNDQNLVFLWDLDKSRSSNQFRDVLHASSPEITLFGHTDKSGSFALDWAKNSYRVGSGGREQNILIWDIDDYQSRLSSTNYMHQFSAPAPSTKRELNSISNSQDAQTLRLKNSITLTGHTDMIEDLSFSPTHKDILVSVGDDRKLLGWDTRVSHTHQFQIEDLHTDDINCVDWSIKNPQLIATGSSDGTVGIIDIRMQKKIRTILTPAYQQFQQQRQAASSTIPSSSTNSSDPQSPPTKHPIMSVRFAPNSAQQNILGIGSDNLYFYNLDDPSQESPPMFSHFGQKGLINDFDWNTEEPWSIVSTCQELEHETLGGGSLQIFRPLDLLCMPEDAAVEKLSQNLVQSNPNQQQISSRISDTAIEIEDATTNNNK